MSAATAKPTGFLGIVPLHEFFALDVRSLALFRIVLGLLILLDWIDRLPDLYTMYSDDGIVPRQILSGLLPISVHLYSGEWWFQGILAGIAIVFALLLLVGWKTPLATLVSFFFLISIHARNPSVMQGGDHLLRIVTFWGIFLPLGAAYSLDAARPGARRASPIVLSPASLGYVAQICIVYFFAAAWKWDDEWRGEANAVYLALSVDVFTTRFGHLVRDLPPELLRWMTRSVIYLEALGPVLLLLPFNVGLQRMIALFLFFGFHLGLALTMELAHFPWVCFCAWIPLLPTSFWDRLQSHLKAGPGLTLVHDPERGGAEAGTSALRMFLFLWQAQHEAAEPALAMRLRKQGGWGVLAEKQELTGTDALTRLVRESPVYFPLVPLFRGGFGRWVVARVGGRGGKSKAAARTPAWTPPGGLAVDALLLFILVYLVLLNIRNFAYTRDQAFPNPARPPQRWENIFPNFNFGFGAALGIDQGWGLFAPQPGRDIGWYLTVGVTEDGTRIDLTTGKEIDDYTPASKPKAPARVFPNGRWRKMTQNLSAYDVSLGPEPPQSRAYPYLLPGYARFLYRDWNRRHPERKIRESEVVYWLEKSMPPGTPPPPPQRISLVRYTEVLDRKTEKPEGVWRYNFPEGPLVP